MIWKKISDYPYSVSDTGLVRNDRTGRILRRQINPHGYYIIRLSVECKPTTFLVHRLVANAFIPNPNDYPEVNHIDGNTLNASADNLEWCSRSMNMRHRIDVLGYKHSRQTIEKIASALRKPIVCVETGTVYNSVAEASNLLNLDDSNISACALGKRHTCGGFHWRWHNAKG